MTFVLNALVSLVIDNHIWGAIGILGGSTLIGALVGAFCWETIPKDTKSVRVKSIMSVIFTY